MIELFVQPYCHDCPEFEPDVIKDEEIFTCFDRSTFKEISEVKCSTKIYCEHRYRCKSIYERAKKEGESNDQN